MFVVEQLVRKYVQNAKSANGPSFVLIIATLLGSAAMIVAYNFDKLDSTVVVPATTHKLKTIGSAFDTCIDDYAALEAKYDVLMRKASLPPPPSNSP